MRGARFDIAFRLSFREMLLLVSLYTERTDNSIPDFCEETRNVKPAHSSEVLRTSSFGDDRQNAPKTRATQEKYYLNLGPGPV